MAGLQTALLWLLVSASWPEPARGAGSGARPAAAAAADRAEAAAAPPALQLLRVGERDAVISFHVSRLPGRLPATHFQLRVAAGGGGGGGGEELRKIAVKAGADCAATDGCQVAASAYTLPLRCTCTLYAPHIHCVCAARRKSSGCSRARGTSSRSPRWRGEEAWRRQRTRRRLWDTTRHLSRSPRSDPPLHHPSSLRPPPPPPLPLPPPPLLCHSPPPRAKARP